MRRPLSRSLVRATTFHGCNNSFGYEELSGLIEIYKIDALDQSRPLWWCKRDSLGGLDFRPSFRLAPEARQPGLLFARQPSRAVVVRDLNEARLREIAAPRLKIMIGTVAAKAPAFLI